MLSVLMLTLLSAGHLQAQFPPGTGLVVVTVGDDFEAPNWSFTHNFPKSSQNLDGNTRSPFGVSVNGKWEEGATRGQPDIIERVARPSGGLLGSSYCLRIRSKDSGIPGSPSGALQQDDILGRIVQIGSVGVIPVSRQPSVIARIRIPPPEEWELAIINAFSFRVGVEGTNNQDNWPGIFFQLNRGARTVTLIARANQFNQDYNLSAPISYDTLLASRNGWMTVGLSFTPDGMMHYYAALGAGNLGSANLMDSRFPGNQPVKQLEYFFSSTVNTDNGTTWGPQFHLDDALVFVNEGTPVALPELKNLQLSGGNFQMDITGMTVGAYYSVDRSGTLATDEWTMVERFLATTALRVFSEDIGTADRRFYRVRTD